MKARGVSSGQQPEAGTDTLSAYVQRFNEQQTTQLGQHQMKSSPLRSSKKGGSHSRSAKKDRSRSASKVSDNSSVMVNRAFQVTEKTTQKMWKMFEQKVHGSMYGLHPAQKIKAQE